MSGGKFNAYGSYIQLNTLDEKEKINNDVKPVILGTLPYRRFLCTRRDIIIIVVALILLFVIVTTSLVIGIPALEEKIERYYHPPTYVSSSPLKTFNNATVVSDGQLCADIGVAMLEQGGHAVDAAIATLFCNGVVNPESMGLGGGFIMLVYNKGKTDVIDAREMAPEAATVDMFSRNHTSSQIGGLTIATPGELRGYWEAHTKYGHLNWSTLIEPSIKICEEGFHVSKHLADKLKVVSKKIENNENWRKAFFNNETNEPYKENAILKRPELAETLRLIAKNGANVLYEGDLAKVLIDDINSCGGIITESDLKNYKVKFKDAISITLNNPSKKTLYTVPPPGCGPILSHILMILDGYNISSKTVENLSDKVLLYHRVIEALKFGFAHRLKLADDEEDASISQLIYDLTSKKFADEVREKISDTETFDPSYYTSSHLTQAIDHGTSHISVLSSNGDAVSVTSTINTYFGSLCISPSTGIIFNNEMDDFTSPNITNFFGIPPSSANDIKPGKRPLSSMVPSIITNDKGDVELITGASGGTRIISSSVEAIVRILWLNESVKVTTDAPRIHHQLIPNHVFYEKQLPQVYRDELMKFGHSFEVERTSSAFLGILNQTKIQTIVDYRRNGSVNGF